MSTSTRLRRRVATGAVLCGLVVAAFEGTVVTSAMPTIARELGGMGAYAWVFSAFLLASTVGVLTCGKLADAYGRRPIFVAGMALFLFGSALCGLSATIGQLVAFRVVQGLGAGAIQPTAMTISADLYTLEERARIQALFTGTWGFASVMGPLVGGFLVAHLSWRWVFLVNLPAGFAAVALLLPSYQDPPRRAGRVHGIGAAALAGALCALALLALDPGELARGWRVPIALAAAAACPAFLFQQRRAARPLVPAALLASRVVKAGLAAGFAVGAILYACAAYVPLWMTTHAHLAPAAAGGALVPLLAGWSIGSALGVRVLVRHGMRASVSGGFTIAAAGALALAFVGSHDLPVTWGYAALAVVGLGTGPAASSSLVAVQSAAPWRQRGVVTSVVYATRLLGGSIAVGALAALDAAGAARFEGLALVACAAAVALAFVAPAGVEDLGAVPAPAE